jgi:hypothetical protein
MALYHFWAFNPHPGEIVAVDGHETLFCDLLLSPISISKPRIQDGMYPICQLLSGALFSTNPQKPSFRSRGSWPHRELGG